MEVKLRLATQKDIDALVAVRFAFFQDENRIPTAKERVQIEESLRNYFQKQLNEGCFVIILEMNNEIISTAFLSILERPANFNTPTGKSGVIINVFTFPAHRKKGYATMALKALIEIAEQKNLSYLELSATAAGKPVYEKLGFTIKSPSRFTDMRLPLL